MSLKNCFHVLGSKRNYFDTPNSGGGGASMHKIAPWRMIFCSPTHNGFTVGRQSIRFQLSSVGASLCWGEINCLLIHLKI